jgi:hypothetical protein
MLRFCLLHLNKQRIMNWYYVRDGKQDGTHSDDALRELARTGVIDSSTARA